MIGRRILGIAVAMGLALVARTAAAQMPTVDPSGNAPPPPAGGNTAPAGGGGMVYAPAPGGGGQVVIQPGTPGAVGEGARPGEGAPVQGAAVDNGLYLGGDDYVTSNGDRGT